MGRQATSAPSVNELWVDRPRQLLLQQNVGRCHEVNPVSNSACTVATGTVKLIIDGQVLLTVAVDFLSDLVRLFVLVNEFLALFAKSSHVRVDVLDFVVLSHGLDVLTPSRLSSVDQLSVPFSLLHDAVGFFLGEMQHPDLFVGMFSYGSGQRLHDEVEVAVITFIKLHKVDVER